MPRKKAIPAAEPVSPPVAAKDTVTLSIEVSQALYDHIMASAARCGYDSIDEWLTEAIMDKV